MLDEANSFWGGSAFYRVTKPDDCRSLCLHDPFCKAVAEISDNSTLQPGCYLYMRNAFEQTDRNNSKFSVKSCPGNL